MRNDTLSGEDIRVERWLSLVYIINQFDLDILKVSIPMDILKNICAILNFEYIEYITYYCKV